MCETMSKTHRTQMAIKLLVRLSGEMQSFDTCFTRACKNDYYLSMFNESRVNFEDWNCSCVAAARSEFVMKLLA